MIVTVGGALGAGKSVVSKLVAEKLNLMHQSNGDFMREIAKNHKMTLMK